MAAAARHVVRSLDAGVHLSGGRCSCGTSFMPLYQALSDFPSPVAVLPPPLLKSGQALFLDVDGTLLELAPSPSEVRVPPALSQLLSDLGDALHGAIAIVSGRSLSTVDELLKPWRPAGAGVHGAELRLPGGEEIQRAFSIGIDLAARLRHLLRDCPEVLIEDKGMAVAVHYARNPQLAAECEGVVNHALRDLPHLRVQRGRFVLEAIPADVDKGAAVQALMRHAPYAGCKPVFVGDDRTDEMAFAAIHAAGGVSVKVGSGPTLAMHRLADPAAVRLWLRAGLVALREEMT